MIAFYDTSSLLFAQDKAFAEHFIISSITLGELEHIKTSDNRSQDIKYRARKLVHLLDEHRDAYTVVHENTAVHDAVDKHFMPQTNDNIIMASASMTTHDVFYSEDLCMRIIGKDVFGLEAKAYDVGDLVADSYVGYKQVQMTDSEYSTFMNTLHNNPFGCLVNEYLIVYDGEFDLRDCWRWNGEEFVSAYNKQLRSISMGDKIKPKDEFQRCAIDSLMNNTVTFISGKPGSGKAQPNDTVIPTPEGNKRIGDIVPGDYVFDRLGKPTKVLGVFPQGQLDNYRLTFSDGRVAYCNDEHIWSCFTSKGNLIDKTVRQMLDAGLYGKRYYKFNIPLNAPVEYQHCELPVHPYVVGYYLGNGCSSESAFTISSQDEDAISRIADIIGAKSYARSHESNYSWLFYFTEEKLGKGKRCRLLTRDVLQGLEDTLIQSSGYKCVPYIYKYASIEQRRELLRGFLDADGSISENKGRVSCSSTSIKLIKDIQEICWSLGYTASIWEDANRGYKYISGHCYSLAISCASEEKPSLFYIRRKRDRALNYCDSLKVWHRCVTTTSIRKIEKVGMAEMTCLYVDNPEHLYLTEDYIVTHNTLLALSAAMHLVDTMKYDRVVIMNNPIPVRGVQYLGALPGSASEKILGGALGNILTSKFGDRMQVELLVQQGKIRLLDMASSRGSSISDREILICTEMENSSADIMKIVLSRVESGAKVFIDGDFKSQIDSRIFEGDNNGMTRAIKVFKGDPLFGYVDLPNIWRSKVAELAEKL